MLLEALYSFVRIRMNLTKPCVLPGAWRCWGARNRGVLYIVLLQALGCNFRNSTPFLYLVLSYNINSLVTNTITLPLRTAGQEGLVPPKLER